MYILYTYIMRLWAHLRLDPPSDPNPFESHVDALAPGSEGCEPLQQWAPEALPGVPDFHSPEASPPTLATSNGSIECAQSSSNLIFFRFGQLFNFDNNQLGEWHSF